MLQIETSKLGSKLASELVNVLLYGYLICTSGADHFVTQTVTSAAI